MSLFLKRWFILENTRADRLLESYDNAENYYIELYDNRLDKKSFIEIFKYLKTQNSYLGGKQIVEKIDDILAIYPDIFSNFSIFTAEHLEINSQVNDNKIMIFYKFKDKTVYLEFLNLEERLRNEGMAKKIFRKLIPFCFKYNFRSINGFAIWVGRYTWARFGFTANPWKLNIQKEFLNYLYLGNGDTEIYKIKHTAEIAAARLRGVEIYLEQLDRMIRMKIHYWKMWDLLRSHIVNENPAFWLNNEFLIGKWSLLGGDAMESISGIVYPADIEGWEMELNFHDAFSMNLLRSYIGLTESEDQDIDASFWRDIPNAISIEVTDNLNDEEYE